jgi:hypothetical protein
MIKKVGKKEVSTEKIKAISDSVRDAIIFKWLRYCK